MDFSLSGDQIALQDSVRRMLGDTCPLERVRAFADGHDDVADAVWRGLTELGVPAMLIPEEFGGLSMTLLDAALVSEALGASAAPSAFLGSALVALAVRDTGSMTQKTRVLPDLASGGMRAAVALSEAVSGVRDGAGLVFDGGLARGSALFVIDGEGADVVVAAPAHGALILMDAAAVTMAGLRTVDRTRRLAEMRCDGAAAETLAGGNVVTAAQGLARLRDAAFVLLAADMLGASQTMLDRAVAYAKERVQFGRPIGSFQAVKHLCAEMAARLEPCRALVWYAAHAFDEGLDDAPVAAAHAKAHLSEVSRFIARTATEVHGGMGFTDLLGLHFWFKRVGVDRQLLGGAEAVRRHAARLQFG
jgi:alkylation response protein AidB-like acyl-CoA dehydrogenase